jgi:nucleotide-binding universal stress UspA family protein
MPQLARSKDRGYQSILCAVDFSLQSSAALQAAADITGRNGGHLTALSVEDPLFGAGAAASGYDPTLLRKSTLDQLRRLVERVVRPTGLPAEMWSADTILGKPASTIVDFAKKMDADLIVMGTNGRRGPSKWFFGSVAEAVLRRAPAALLVVARSRPGRAGLRVQGRPVLGAIELGPSARDDARRMARVAERVGGPLTLLHVVNHVPDPPEVPRQLDQYHHRRLLAARKRLASIARSVGAASRVVLGIPEDEIGAVASETKAGLIVLALRRGRGLFGPRQGTTTYRVLCASTIPVFALPPDKGR